MIRRPHLVPAVAAGASIVLDVVTKRWAVEALAPMHVPHEVVGPWVRFTLAFNKGAAFGMHLGDWSRVAFGVIALVILGVLISLYRETPDHEPWRRLALALVAGGAVGNLIDRIRWSQGVVDFIDIGTTTWRFWTFNIADSAVTVGTILLLWTMREEPTSSDGQQSPEPAA